MSSGSSGSIVDRIIAWFRGIVAPPQGEQRDASSRQQTGPAAADRGSGDITEPLRDTTATSEAPTTAAEPGATGERHVLPDLDDSESDYEYSGTGSAQAASAPAEEEHLSGDRSDFDDAGGDVEPEEVSYPTEGTEDGMDEVHNAVGRHDEDEEDRIDSSRDREFAGREVEPDNVPEPRGEDLERVSEQDELTAFEGASTDEFAAGGYAPAPTEEEDVEAAAETTSQHDMNGVPAADTPSGVAREDIESRSEAGAFAQGDEAVTAPGQSDASTFADASTGTMEPSRSATGNNVDDEQDALGTTLEYTEDEENSFDTEEANLSAEGELGVMDEGIAEAADVTDETSVSDMPYADIPDTPTPEDVDDTGRDDFAGSEYPSDRRVDRLDGDDAFDAVEPDVDAETSSAGDLEQTGSEETLIGESESTVDTGGGSPIGQRAIEQEMVGTSDEHVGGEEPGFVDNMQDIDVPSGESTAGTAPTGTDVDAPAGAVRGDGTTNTPDGYPIKGNANSMIYHLPSFPSYKNTKAEFCFATEQDAIAAGYRAPGRRNRGRPNP